MTQDDPRENTMLQLLEAARVVAVSRLSDGRFEVQEQCDYYFKTVLTADELRQWAQELTALADGETGSGSEK